MKSVQKWIYRAGLVIVFLAASAAASATQVWEYAVEQVHAPMNSQTLQALENKLAAKGQAGWELVAIVLHGRMYTLTYKRPKQFGRLMMSMRDAAKGIIEGLSSLCRTF